MADVEWTPSKKVSKPKQKQKKQKKSIDLALSPVPRLQLEPRLTSPTKKSKVSDQLSDIEKEKKLFVMLNRNTVSEYFERRDAPLNEEGEPFSLQKALSFLNPTGESTPNPSSPEKNFDALSLDFETSASFFQKKKKAVKKNPSNSLKGNRTRRIRKGVLWKDSDMKYLAHGLQAHGFADLDKIAAFMKTKNENEIREYVKHLNAEARLFNRNEVSKTDSSETQTGRAKNAWRTLKPYQIQNWPNVRKWRRLAHEQMLPYTRGKDYSKPVIQALCKKFYEEEEEPSDPQVINVKLIYKYLMDCTSGHTPSQLPPKESALVLDMLRETRLIPIAYDFEEERNFLQTYKTATKFKPFEVKDEFKKKLKKALDDDAVAPETVPVPEPIFANLSRHKKLVQSFNPLVVPVWMSQKEQEYLKNYQEESVYVD